MKNWLLQVVALLLCVWGLTQGRSLTPEVEDSLHALHPRMRAHWLKERGIDAPGYTRPFFPDSLNMSCVGRWSYGPSYDVTGRIADHDTIVFLGRGSGVSVLQFHGGAQPSVTLLSDINAMGLVRRVVTQDSWLFVGTSGVEIYNVSQPTNPTKVAWISTAVSDLALQDSFLYSVNSESLTVFNIADKTSPYRVGAVADSGSAVAVAGGKAYLIWDTFGWHGMYILDVSNPRLPHRAGIWGSAVDAVAARGSLCYEVGGDRRFHILDMANPGSPHELSSVGIAGRAIYLHSGFAYTTNFAIVDIMDSMMPGIVGTCTIPGGSGIWATGDYGYVFFSCYDDGLGVVDCRDPVHPRMDSVGILACSESRDIDVQGGQALVANAVDGVRLLNVADPAHPFEIASYDTAGQPPTCDAARLTGSLAYLDWWGRDGWHGLYVVSFADSTNPVLVGKGATYYPIQAMAIRDSFVFAAEGNWFEVMSIRDSIHPSVASRCSLRALAPAYDVQVIESTAYVANSAGGLRMIDVTDPNNITPLGFFVPPHQYSTGMAIQDTIAYIGTDQGLCIANVRSPLAPYEIAFYPTEGWLSDVGLRGNLVYVTYRSAILDVSDPAHPRELGYYDNGPSGLFGCWRDSLIYVACYDDGVTILRYYGPGSGVGAGPRSPTKTGDLGVFPNPTTGKCFVRGWPNVPGMRELGIYDLSGRMIEQVSLNGTEGGVLDLNRLRAGIYFLKETVGNSVNRITVLR
jgi:hypothetical protein